ncbi:MAG: hypothetical protein ACI8SE_002141, partial [Bacteroidia bacterium]
MVKICSTKFWAIALLMLCITSCYSGSDNSNRSFYQGSIDAAVSELCFPISISLSDIENTINKQLKRQLITNKPLNKSTKLSIKRTGNLRVTGSSGNLQTAIPMEVEIYQKKLIDLPPVTFSLTLFMSSEVEIRKDWSVSSVSQVSHYIWNEEPSMSIFGLKVGLKTKVEKYLNKEKRNISKSLDKLVKSKVNITKPASKIWRDLQIPRNLLKTRGDTLFLKVVPHSVNYISHTIEKRHLTLQIKINADLKAYSSAGAESFIVKKLPKLKFDEKECDGFHVDLITSVYEEDLNASLNKHLGGVAIPVMDLTYNLTGVKVSCSASNLQLQIGVKGFTTGTIGALVGFGIDTNTNQLDLHISEIGVVEGDLQMSVAVEAINYYVNNNLSKFQGFDYQSYLDDIPTIIQNAV